MILDLYLTVRGYGQKFHQYDRNMRRSPGGTPEERNPHHKCLRIMLPQGLVDGGAGNLPAGTAKPARYLPQEVPHGL
ncbi:hypothetical protein RM6536_1622 [Rothia mucilaginosa]|uniref:Uncharacterized protein n=1 Tax=Rothia mucilaginosa TaxID=43675 RepID=A0A0K2S1A7_9MICC|nr:hypothetical protein RM6536_1622 [Rothia mucilaginosa]